MGALDRAQDSQEIMDVSVRYLHLGLGCMKQISTAVVISRPGEVTGDMVVDQQIQEATHRLDTARAITDAVRMADANNLRGYVARYPIASSAKPQLQH